MLMKADKPLIVAGGGIINADASDLLVEFANGQKNMHNLVGLGDYLENAFGRKVDLVTKPSLSKHIGPHILREVQYASFAD